jgi:hypothetical protein
MRIAKIVKGVDPTKYKDLKYMKDAARKKNKQYKQEMPDKQKLSIMRGCQFSIGFMGLVGDFMTFYSLYYSTPVLRVPITRSFTIEIELILLGCTLALAGVIGMIGFQHKHDTISDRMAARKEVF